MELEPMGDRVVVEADGPESVTKSGIIIPDKSQERPQFGTVLAVGDLTGSINPGDKILYSKYGGTEVMVDGSEFLILRAMDILARVKGH